MYKRQIILAAVTSTNPSLQTLRGASDLCVTSIEAKQWVTSLTLLELLDPAEKNARGERAIHFLIKHFDELAKTCISWKECDKPVTEQLTWWLESLDLVEIPGVTDKFKGLGHPLKTDIILDGLRERGSWSFSIDDLLNYLFQSAPHSHKVKATMRTVLLEGHLEMCAMPTVLRLLERAARQCPEACHENDQGGTSPIAVSYTHLTLPTIYSV